jgi:hypothetical protein
MMGGDGLPQVVDDDVDEPRAERVLLVLLLVGLHGFSWLTVTNGWCCLSS